MYEGNFFKALLLKLRTAGFSAYATLPAKTSYPAIECEFLESRTFEDKVFIRFNLKLFFDGATFDQNAGCCTKVAKLVEQKIVLDHGAYAVPRKLSQKSLPREKGSLFVVVQEYEAMIRHI